VAIYLIFTNNTQGFTDFELFIVDAQGRQDAGARDATPMASTGCPYSRRMAKSCPGPVAARPVGNRKSSSRIGTMLLRAPRWGLIALRSPKAKKGRRGLTCAETGPGITAEDMRRPIAQ